MSLRHSKSLNATACTLCVHVSSPLCVRVCAWYSVCVCAYVLACVHETEGRTPRWDCARAGEMRRCMWPSHERALIALEGEIIQLNHHIHPPHDIHHVKLYMVPLEKCSVSAEYWMELYRKLLLLHWVALYAYVPLLEGDVIFSDTVQLLKRC